MRPQTRHPAKARVTDALVAALWLLLLSPLGACSSAAPTPAARCEEACQSYMSGEPGVSWVAPYADGPGYQALLTCMNEGMSRGASVEGMVCWQPRVDACRIACVRAEGQAPTP